MFLTFVDMKLFYSLKADTTALSGFSTGNSQGIVWVYIYGLSGSGFRG